jgi:HPt (histidine-containing phosphotransfer) domain-containing protein
MEPSTTTLKGRIFDLKQRFVQTMPERIVAIATTLDGCIAGGDEALQRLERQFHTLAGTAGTYDLRAVAGAAFEGEEACVELRESPLDSENFTYLTFLVNQLRGALAIDAPGQWSARTVLTAADAPEADAEHNGVSAA